MSELLPKLSKLYGGSPLHTDQFGRRSATPNEIAKAMDECMTGFDGEEWDNVPTGTLLAMCQEMVDRYYPTDLDIKEKDEGQQRR